ncbi:hypothetical protein SEEH0318_22689, partial [Salmonella enterica subsp. enterica serovar Heidelberg str. 90-0318]
QRDGLQPGSDWPELCSANHTSEKLREEGFIPSMADSLIPPGRLLPLIPRLFLSARPALPFVSWRR